MDRLPVHMFSALEGSQQGVEPLINVGSEKQVYALVAEKRGRLTWALPDHTTGHRAWLVHVLKHLHGVDPERFPGEPDWQAAKTWATASLATAHAELEARRSERERLLAAADEQIAVAAAAVDEERSRAVAGWWRLLTAQDAALVAAVREALTTFGFLARELDEEHHQRHGRRLEDLRVTDPDNEDWESLVEVKGYTKGAKATDVYQVLRAPTTYFIVDVGREPKAVWHIVNVFRETSPTMREPVSLTDADLADLTEAHGALIDTRDLFRAVRAVEDRTIDAAEVRRSLREAVTRWNWPG